MIKYRAGALLVTVVAATLLTGCASSTPSSVTSDQPSESSDQPEIDDTLQEVAEDHLDDVSDSALDDESANDLRAEAEERLTGFGWTLDQWGGVSTIERDGGNYDRAVVPVTISRDGCGPFEINIIGDVPGDWRVSAMVDTSVDVATSDVSQQTSIIFLERDLCGL